MGHADAKTTQVYAHYQPSEAEAGVVDGRLRDSPTLRQSRVVLRKSVAPEGLE
jgi:hypothetical protein